MTRTLVVFLSSLSAAFSYPNGSRIPAGNAGEPGTGTPCASCHSVTLNPSGGGVKLTLPGEATFSPGTTQRWTLTITDANSSYRRGFQLSAAGTFTAGTGTTIVASSGKQYVSHTASANTYTFDWTAPANVDTVTVYFAGVAASGTRSTHVYTGSVTLTKSGAKPAITSGGVVNAATYAAGIQAGSWVTIYGSNLAPSGVAREWTAADIVNGVLPTALEGTRVTINGKPAAIAYVSPDQLNVQAPEDASTGSVAVVVTTASGASDQVVADLRTAAPGFFRFSAQSYRYAAAVNSDGTYSGPAGLVSASTRPAKPGETILLFGTGFGATNPSVAGGQAYSGAAPLAAGNNLSVRIGGVAATVSFAGLSAPGLYQFNVVVPEVADGDQALEASAWGANVVSTQYLSVKR